jgi:hypothetical protein
MGTIVVQRGVCAGLWGSDTLSPCREPSGVHMNLIFKLPVFLVLLFILISLFQGMYYLAKDDGRDKTRVVRALTLRVALSLLLFVLLMAGYFFGFLHPHGIGGGA